MKRIAMAMLCGLVACTLLAAEGKKMTLDEAREQIAAVIADPEKAGEIMKQLSAEDQNKFMAEVNKAIAALPGSNEAKTAKYLNVNREMLLNAQKGNLQALVATMFATVRLDGLTVLAERYGEDLFNRDSGESKAFTDEQFTEIASSTVKEVAKACEGLSDAAPRDTLAIYLFEKASNGSIPELEDRLLEVAISDTQTREVAKGEWLAAAKSEGSSGFSGMLAYAEAGRVPNVERTLENAGPQPSADALPDLQTQESAADTADKAKVEETRKPVTKTEDEDAEKADEEKPNVDVVLPIAGAQVQNVIVNEAGQNVVDAQGRKIMPATQGESATGRDTATASQIAQSTAVAAQNSEQPKTNADVPYNPSYSREEAQEVKEELKKEEEQPQPEPEPEPKPYLYQD